MDFFFFNDTAPAEISTLSLHDALPIAGEAEEGERCGRPPAERGGKERPDLRQQDDVERPAAAERAIEQVEQRQGRSEEHTSELQSRQYLVCRLLLEKKKGRELLDLQPN